MRRPCVARYITVCALNDIECGQSVSGDAFSRELIGSWIIEELPQYPENGFGTFHFRLVNSAPSNGDQSPEGQYRMSVIGFIAVGSLFHDDLFTMSVHRVCIPKRRLE